MKKLSLLLLLIGICFSSYSQKADRLAVFFPNNNYEISPSSQKEIEFFLQSIDSNSFITLNGVANFIGDYNSNLKLSRNRAIAVKKLIVSKGIPENKIELQFQGERHTRQTPNAIIESRRVDIMVYQKKEAPYSNLSNHFDLTSFDIPYPERNTNIKAPYGTIIEIEGSSFIYKNTKETVSKPITIKLKEFYKKSEFIEYKLSTSTTDDKMLESGGMIYLEAWEGNQELELAKEITIKFPTKTRKENMQTFLGKESRGIVKWDSINNGEPLLIVEELPEFKNGEITLSYYLQQNTRYPTRALEAEISGTVMVNFVVTSKGQVRNVKTIGKKLGYGLEEEAIRVIKTMPRWKPGKNNGKAVDVVMDVPTTFSIDGDNVGLFSNGTSIKKDARTIKQDRRKFEKILADEKDTSKIEASTLSYYILSSPSLGYINCDRFIRDRTQNIALTLKDNGADHISMVFTTINSVIHQRPFDQNKVDFLNIATNYPIKILATKVVGKKTLVSLTDSNSINSAIGLNKLEEMTAEELKKLMQSFDN